MAFSKQVKYCRSKKGEPALSVPLMRRHRNLGLWEIFCGKKSALAYEMHLKEVAIWWICQSWDVRGGRAVTATQVLSIESAGTFFLPSHVLLEFCAIVQR